MRTINRQKNDNPLSAGNKAKHGQAELKGEMMTISELLKDEDADIRVQRGLRYTLRRVNEEFIVTHHKKHQKGSTVLYRGESEEEAVRILLN